MQYEIKELSSYAASILVEPKHALVHSVYRRTINLACKAEILSLQTQNSTLSPISLITELSETAMDQLCAAAGDRVMLSPSEIQIFTASGRKAVFQISSARCRLRDLKLHCITSKFRSCSFASYAASGSAGGGCFRFCRIICKNAVRFHAGLSYSREANIAYMHRCAERSRLGNGSRHAMQPDRTRYRTHTKRR